MISELRKFRHVTPTRQQVRYKQRQWSVCCWQHLYTWRRRQTWRGRSTVDDRLPTVDLTRRLTLCVVHCTERWSIGRVHLIGNKSRMILVIENKLYKTAENKYRPMHWHFQNCQNYFATDLPSCVFKNRQDKFVLHYKSTVNGFCTFCSNLYRL